MMPPPTFTLALLFPHVQTLALVTTGLGQEQDVGEKPNARTMLWTWDPQTTLQVAIRF